MASQKYWQDEGREDLSIDLDDDMAELDHEECEAIFREECRQWLKDNSTKVLGTPFANAYKKPWVKKPATIETMVDVPETPTKKSSSRKLTKDDKK